MRAFTVCVAALATMACTDSDPTPTGTGPDATATTGAGTGTDTGTTPAARLISDRIVFSSMGKGSFELFSIRPDGTDLQRLTRSETDHVAVFGVPSPDGNAIAYTHGIPTKSGRRDQIWVMDADGANPRMVADLGRQPSWSPDGTKLVFHSAGRDATDIYIVDVDGQNEINVTETELVDEVYASWSPDGSQIVYTQTEEDGNVDIWVMNADGRNRYNLTDRFGAEGVPSFSPDGSSVLYQSNATAAKSTGDREIHVIGADGNNDRTLTDNEVHDVNASWSPDGTEVVLSRRRKDLSYDLWVVTVDGSAEDRQLTDTAFDDINGANSWAR